MNNSTAPSLTGYLLPVTQIELVAPTTVAGTLYGIAFSLFCLYVHALAPRLRNGDRTRQAKFMFSYSTVIMLCGLYFLVSNAWVTQDAYIKHSDYPGGPYIYVKASFLTTPVIPIGLTCQYVIDVLTSVIQIWRVWVIWSATRYAKLVVVLPLLCLLSFAALEVRTIVLDTTVSSTEALGSLDLITEQAKSALQGTTTILCTVLISLYLTFKQWQQRKSLGETEGCIRYMSIVAMIVESYALESIWLLAMAILAKVWIGLPAFAFFGESLLYVEIIAYLLVQYRVVSGKAYPSQRQQQNMSSLRWNHSDHRTTQFGETGERQGSSHVSAIPETAPYVPQVSDMA